MSIKSYVFCSRFLLLLFFAPALLAYMVPFQTPFAGPQRLLKQESGTDGLRNFNKVESTPIEQTREVDLEEEFLSDFILETRKLEIPGFPEAFNPSIIEWGDAYLMSFRVSDYRLASDEDVDPINVFPDHARSTNQMGVVFLDSDFNIISQPQIITVRYDDPWIGQRQQDPRLIKVGGRLYMVYSNIIRGVEKAEVRRVFVVELDFDGNYFYPRAPVCLAHFEGENESRWQKNWVPFGYKRKLLLSYSIEPHRIFQPNLKTGECETIASISKNISWDWGVLRGGTQAFLVDGQYLSFFHSSKEMKSLHSKGKKITHYFMGAYTFEARPPFALTAISPKPIVGENFYHGPLLKTWKPLHVVFPGGFVFKKGDPDTIAVFMGRQDGEILIALLSKKGLLKSLQRL